MPGAAHVVLHQLSTHPHVAPTGAPEPALNQSIPLWQQHVASGLGHIFKGSEVNGTSPPDISGSPNVVCEPQDAGPGTDKLTISTEGAGDFTIPFNPNMTVRELKDNFLQKAPLGDWMITPELSLNGITLKDALKISELKISPPDNLTVVYVEDPNKDRLTKLMGDILEAIRKPTFQQYEEGIRFSEIPQRFSPPPKYSAIIFPYPENAPPKDVVFLFTSTTNDGSVRLYLLHSEGVLKAYPPVSPGQWTTVTVGKDDIPLSAGVDTNMISGKQCKVTIGWDGRNDKQALTNIGRRRIYSCKLDTFAEGDIKSIDHLRASGAPCSCEMRKLAEVTEQGAESSA